jgi:PST family polysaccharide transporter
VKSNRLALSFGLPFGVGLALFAEPLIVDGLGSRWAPAVGVVQAFALVAAADQVFFNWTAFHRALGNTRPIAVASVTMMVVFVGVAIPLLLAEGLDGLGIGMAITGFAGLCVRAFYVRRLFGGVGLVRLVVVAAVPTALGALAVLGLDAPVYVYVAVVAVVTWLLQGSLFREALGYLARRSSAQSEPATRPA